MTKRVMRIPTPSPPGHLGVIDLADSEKTEALAESGEPVSADGLSFSPCT